MRVISKKLRDALNSRSCKTPIPDLRVAADHPFMCQCIEKLWTYLTQNGKAHKAKW